MAGGTGGPWSMEGGSGRDKLGDQEQSKRQHAWACCYPSSAIVDPIWPHLLCSISCPGASLCLQHTQEAAFLILESTFFYSTVLPMLIYSLGWSTQRTPPRLLLVWHFCQARAGSTPVSSLSPSCPSGDCSQRCPHARVPSLHSVPMPRVCLLAVCPSRDMGAGLGVPVGT